LKKTALLAIALVASSVTGAMATDTGWTTHGINFRTGPSTEFYSLAKIGACEKLDVHEEVDDWYRVEWNGQWGWIAAKYFSAGDDHCRYYEEPAYEEAEYEPAYEEPKYEEPVYEKPKSDGYGY
jgi:uncharacterized protein YraI